MDRAIKMIEDLMEANAWHRRGFRIKDQTDEEILSHAIDELRELIDNPNDPMEMGDVLGLLLHYCIRKGWTEAYLERKILEKLPQRFSPVLLTDFVRWDIRAWHIRRPQAQSMTLCGLRIFEQKAINRSDEFRVVDQDKTRDICKTCRSLYGR